MQQRIMPPYTLLAPLAPHHTYVQAHLLERLWRLTEPLLMHCLCVEASLSHDTCSFEAGTLQRGPTRHLVTLLFERLAEGRDEEESYVVARVATHQTDAPNFACQVAQSVANLDLKPFEDV